MNFATLKSDLMRDEALRLEPYHDTAGKLTIGYGRNLDDNGISEAEAEAMLVNDMVGILDDLDRAFPWWRTLPEPAARALANMAFNLGLPRLKGFVKMLDALMFEEFNRAANEALDSRWAGQVGSRAPRIAALYRSANRRHRT